MSSKRRATPRHVRTHAWELEEANWVDSDSDFDGPQWDSESDDDNMDNLSPREGLQHFVSLMLSLYMEGTLSARVVCVLFHWVSTFFSDAEIRKYAKKPGLPSGHYAQHLDKESGLTESRSQHYTVKMPGHRRHDLSRTVHDIPVRVGHEELDEEVKADPSIAFRLAELVHDRSLPPSYYTPGSRTVAGLGSPHSTLRGCCSLFTYRFNPGLLAGKLGKWCQTFACCCPKTHFVPMRLPILVQSLCYIQVLDMGVPCSGGWIHAD